MCLLLRFFVAQRQALLRRRRDAQRRPPLECVAACRPWVPKLERHPDLAGAVRGVVPAGRAVQPRGDAVDECHSHRLRRAPRVLRDRQRVLDQEGAQVRGREPLPGAAAVRPALPELCPEPARRNPANRSQRLGVGGSHRRPLRGLWHRRGHCGRGARYENTPLLLLRVHLRHRWRNLAQQRVEPHGHAEARRRRDGAGAGGHPAQAAGAAEPCAPQLLLLPHAPGVRGRRVRALVPSVRDGGRAAAAGRFRLQHGGCRA